MPLPRMELNVCLEVRQTGSSVRTEVWLGRVRLVRSILIKFINEIVVRHDLNLVAATQNEGGCW